MAELAVLSLLLAPVLQELVRIAFENYLSKRSSERCLGNDLENFKKQLDFFKPHLNCADRSNREEVKRWVKELRSLAFEFEDILDDHNYCKSGGVADKGAVGAFGRISGKAKAVGKAEARPKIAERLEGIKPALNFITSHYNLVKDEIDRMCTRSPSTSPRGNLDPGSSSGAAF